uniref:Uncharacterized protein n=1 Tax=Asparagus officinalis TaxID=4686 RepID=Q2XNS4_ASPOF|nr:hypothetical protein 9.t00013 [Asparagus officinalis]
MLLIGSSRVGPRHDKEPTPDHRNEPIHYLDRRGTVLESRLAQSKVEKVRASYLKLQEELEVRKAKLERALMLLAAKEDKLANQSGAKGEELDNEAEEGSAEEAGEASEGSAKQVGKGSVRDNWMSSPDKKGEGAKPEVQLTLVPPTTNAPLLSAPRLGVDPSMSPNPSP